MYKRFTIILVSLFAVVSASAQSADHLSTYIGRVATPEVVAEILGPVYEYDKQRGLYRTSYDLWLEVGIHEDPDNDGRYLEKIREIYVSADHLKEGPVFGDIIYGLKAGEKYEKCEGILFEHPAVTYVEPGGDLNGKLIEFGYVRPDKVEVHYHVRFRPKKSKWRLAAFYVRKRR